MNSWEYLWITIQRDIKLLEIGDWHIVLPDKTKIQGKPLVEEYINNLGAQGWEQVSSVGELRWIRVFRVENGSV